MPFDTRNERSNAWDDEASNICQALVVGAHGGRTAGGRGLNSSIFQLNVSAFCGIGCALRGCLGGG
jgi:hypothetical protein